LEQAIRRICPWREVCDQIESKEHLVRIFCQLVRNNGPLKKDESKRLLERAARDAILVLGVTERMKALNVWKRAKGLTK